MTAPSGLKVRNTVTKCCLAFLLFLGSFAYGNQDGIRIKDRASLGSFPIVSKTATRIVIDINDAKVVQIAASLFSEDIERVTNQKAEVLENLPSKADNIIIIGTIGKSRFIDELVSSGKLKISKIKDQWEAFTITTVQKPTRGIGKALVIAGSDRRGTAFGVFTLSEAIGVSPWYYWADVPTPKKKQIHIGSDTIIQGIHLLNIAVFLLTMKTGACSRGPANNWIQTLKTSVQRPMLRYLSCS